MTEKNHENEPVIKLDSLPVPECALFMKAEFIEYKPGESITFSFPVKKEYANPGGSMQGGFISAAFDNVFGPLSVLEMQTVFVTTTNITTSYHRPVFPGDIIKVTAFVKNKGNKKIHLIADAFNRLGKIVASASSDYLVVEPK